MSLVQVEHLTFAYENSSEPVFDDVSFSFDTDWHLGFTGRNGRGKTTFLKLLMGEYEYRGRITASVSFAYFPYTVEDGESMALCAVEEIYPEYELWRLKKEMAALELSEDALYMPFNTLSMGERTKLLLAVLFLKENCFLLIDEPTNHLDDHGREIVSRYLQGKSGFLLVSHDRAFLDGAVDHILSINRADIELQKGNFASWYENRRRQDAFELAQNDRLEKDISRLGDSVRRTAGWSDKVEAGKLGGNKKGGTVDRGHIGHQSAKMMKRAKGIEQRRKNEIEEKSALLKNIEKNESLKLFPGQYRKEELLSFRDLELFYGEHRVCGPVSFELKRGERIAVRGRNGCGKSTLLKLILGEDISYRGEFRKGSGLAISYVSQDTSMLRGSLADYAEQSGIDESLLKALLRKLDFSRPQLEKNMEDLSGGQKKKVLIARSLCEQAHLYIWDEPLNYVDVLSRIQIEELLLEFQPTLLFVEHDRAFCERIAASPFKDEPFLTLSGGYQ